MKILVLVLLFIGILWNIGWVWYDVKFDHIDNLTPFCLFCGVVSSIGFGYALKEYNEDD